MRINVTDTLKGYDGQPVVEKENPVTYREVFSMALNNPGTVPLTPEQKTKAFLLTVRLHGSDDIDLTVDEAAFIKERVPLVYESPLIFGRVCELLDGAGTRSNA